MLLHAIDTGTGPGTVLLLHGMMGSSESWWRLIPPLAANGHRVIALDLPGHGLSERDPQLTICLLYTSPSPRDQRGSRMPSSA